MMAKTLKKMLEVYRPKAGDEQKFMDKHIVVKTADRNGNKDDVFQATNVKTVKRKEEKHGYDQGEDEKVYEEAEPIQEGEQSHAQFEKYHSDAAKLLKNIHGGLSKHYSAVTDKKGYNKGQAHWGHVGDIKHIHRQLQDIHDQILQQGEYAKPVLAREEAEVSDSTVKLLELFSVLSEENRQAMLELVESGQSEEIIKLLELDSNDKEAVNG